MIRSGNIKKKNVVKIYSLIDLFIHIIHITITYIKYL